MKVTTFLLCALTYSQRKGAGLNEEGRPLFILGRILDPVTDEEIVNDNADPAGSEDGDRDEDTDDDADEDEDEEDDEDVSESDNTTDSSYIKNPATDPYYNDVLPEVEDELYKTPRQMVVKIVGAVVGIFLLIVILVLQFQ